jgi:RNA polymerase sigma factor (sigma-70 family)
MSKRIDPPENGGDPTLLRLLREGDADAARALYSRYARRLRALVDRKLGPDLASRVDPDDIVQSVFRTFLRGVAERRYHVPKGQDLWGLFLVLALNKVRACGQFHRAAKRDVRVTHPLDRLEGPAECVTDAADDPFLHALAQDLLEQFLPVHRKMIQLRLEGYAVAEIATRTHRSRRTVERILQSCRASLLELVDSHD